MKSLFFMFNNPNRKAQVFRPGSSNHSMTHTLRNAAVAFLVLAGLVGGARAEIIEQILVKVNGELFTKTDLEVRQIAALRDLGQRVDPQNANLGDAELRTMLDEVTPELIVNVVDEMLLVQRGRELGYRLGDEQFTGILDNLKKENKIENDEQFQAALKQEGMTLADLRRNLERRMIVSRIEQNEILGRIAVSEGEAREYYDAHVAEFTKPESITLREIFVAVPADGGAVNVAQDEAAREKADQIRQRALAGESFEKLAGDLSDAPSRANAGLIGPLNLSELSPDLQKLVQAMEVGQVSEVQRSARGYQVLKLESMTPPDTLPFDQAREQIGDRVFTDKRQVEYEKFLSRLRSEAIIEWKNEEIRKAYEIGLGKQRLEARD
jgi:peptidyl-prolyl cis-trans isomerase SurA